MIVKFKSIKECVENDIIEVKLGEECMMKLKLRKKIREEKITSTIRSYVFRAGIAEIELD